jgi:hypothetical protein
MATRTLIATDFETGERRTLAEFKMVKGRVAIKWTEAGRRMMMGYIETDGIALNDKVLMPSDGKQYYDGLLIVFSQSSLVHVADV